MQKDSKFFDDMAKMASGAAGGLLEMKREMEAMMAMQAEKLLQKMHLATQEEAEALRGMLSAFRQEQENLKKRLDRLEEMVNSLANKHK